MSRAQAASLPPQGPFVSGMLAVQALLKVKSQRAISISAMLSHCRASAVKHVSPAAPRCDGASA